PALDQHGLVAGQEILAVVGHLVLALADRAGQAVGRLEERERRQRRRRHRHAAGIEILCPGSGGEKEQRKRYELQAHAEPSIGPTCEAYPRTHARPASSSSISTKPSISPAVAKLSCPWRWDSGMTSWLTTYSIAPADRPKPPGSSHGEDRASAAPPTAVSGSIRPEAMPAST